MIKVSVMYPAGEGANFDLDYYCNTHVPLVGRLLGDAVKDIAIDSGIAGGAPGQAAPFVAIGHLVFDSVETFQGSFGPNADQILSDLPNFTNIQPQIQISEIKA